LGQRWRLNEYGARAKDKYVHGGTAMIRTHTNEDFQERVQEKQCVLKGREHKMKDL
jgi:hypothetical protein